jgi:hypothetical protein
VADIQSIIERATNDEAFARELKQQAAAAQAAGPGTPEWTGLMEHFAASPEALDAKPEGHWTTVTTITSPECLTTTTTTGH